MTSFHKACEDGELDKMEAYIRAGVDVDHTARNYYLSVHVRVTVVIRSSRVWLRWPLLGTRWPSVRLHYISSANMLMHVVCINAAPVMA